MPEERFTPGQQVAQYVLERKIDAGGMGEVWQARAPDRRSVAIKFAHRQFAHDPRFLDLARREASAQIKLRHRNIVAAEGVLEVDGAPAIVFYYVDGNNLEAEIYGPAKQLEAGRPLPVPRALSIATEILDALDFAHQHGFVHRDVKSSNILLERATGQALLTDFGLVLNLASQRMTRAGTISGSVPYMSPEQITNPLAVNLRTDVYSFGVVLYEMLTGVLPFRVEPGEMTDPDFLIKEKHLKREPVPPSFVNPAVPKALDRIVLQALEKVPDRRFLGCGQFRRTVMEFEQSPEAEEPARRKVEFFLGESPPVVPEPAPRPQVSRRSARMEPGRKKTTTLLPFVLVGISALIVIIAIVYRMTR